jgi:hypothetical protein
VLGQPRSLNTTTGRSSKPFMWSERQVDATGANGYATLTPGWPDDPDPGFSAHPGGDQPNSSRNPSRHDGYSRVSPNSALALALLAARSWVP